MRAVSSADLESAHSTAGRSGVPCASASTTPCICPENPTDDGLSPLVWSTWSTTSRVAASHSAGSLSAHPGRGADTA